MALISLGACGSLEVADDQNPRSDQGAGQSGGLRASEERQVATRALGEE